MDMTLTSSDQRNWGSQTLDVMKLNMLISETWTDMLFVPLSLLLDVPTTTYWCSEEYAYLMDISMPNEYPTNQLTIQLLSLITSIYTLTKNVTRQIKIIFWYPHETLLTYHINIDNHQDHHHIHISTKVLHLSHQPRKKKKSKNGATSSNWRSKWAKSIRISISHRILCKTFSSSFIILHHKLERLKTLHSIMDTTSTNQDHRNCCHGSWIYRWIQLVCPAHSYSLCKIWVYHLCYWSPRSWILWWSSMPHTWY